MPLEASGYHGKERAKPSKLVDQLMTVMHGAYASLRNLATSLSKEDREHVRNMIFGKVANFLGKAYIKISKETDLAKVVIFEGRVRDILSEKEFRNTAKELFELLTYKDQEGAERSGRFFELLAKIYNRVSEIPLDTEIPQTIADVHRQLTQTGNKGSQNYLSHRQNI